MDPIPDIDDTEFWVMGTTLRERYAREVELHLADAEVRLHPSDRELTPCQAIVWQADDGCHFALFKSGDRSYRCQFFCKRYQQMGTGTAELDNLAVALLQAQADSVAQQRGDLFGPGH